LERLREFYEGLGRTVPTEITFDTLIAYRETWGTFYPSAATRHGVQQKLRGYLKYLHTAGHIDRIPELPTIQVGEPDNAEAFTDAEVEKILATIPRQFLDPENAARLRAFVLLMLDSGLRIGDTARIERNAITYDEANDVYQVRVTQKKTKYPVFVPIQPAVAREILAVANASGEHLFWTGRCSRERAANNWQEQMKELFRAAGFPKGHSHQFRHTFARVLLSRGVPLEEVSRSA
jgi:integrase